MFNPFTMAASAGRNLFGGLFDGQPGAFSHLQGGAPDLFRYGVFQSPQGAVPPAQPQAQPQVGQVPAPGKVSIGRTIADVLINGENPYSSIDRQRTAPMAQAGKAALFAKAREVITDPREWMVFVNNPEEWAKQNATRYGFQQITGGNTYGNLGSDGGVKVAPKLEQNGDRTGVTTVGPDGVPRTQYGEARGPTFAELSEDAKRKADIDRAIKELQLRREQHEARKAAGGYGTPGVGGGEMSGMSDEQLFALIQGN